MIFIGVDNVEISRFNDKLLHNKRFLNFCFTKVEQHYCFEKINPSQHFAVRYAAKEAVNKAISALNKTLVYSAIEIQNAESGRPLVILHTNDEELLKMKVEISLSHSASEAIAFAVVYSEGLNYS